MLDFLIRQEDDFYTRDLFPGNLRKIYIAWDVTNRTLLTWYLSKAFPDPGVRMSPDNLPVAVWGFSSSTDL